MAETFTVNYNWTKPEIGASIDVWGGFLNTDLDGIDATVHGIQSSIPAPASTTPVMDGTAAIGVGATFARADHVHPSDTSRAPLASPTFTGVPAAPTASGGTNNTQLATTAFVAAAVPAASSTTPAMDGTAAVGVGATFARADHVHPSDTSRYAASNPSGYQTAAQVMTSLGAYLPLAGGTLTGPLVLAANPAAPLQPATKQYVDSLSSPSNPNRIDNGDMYVSQRGAGTVSVLSGGANTVDRWFAYATQSTKYTIGQNYNGQALAPGFQQFYGVQSASAFTPASTDEFFLSQGIEADTIGDFLWGSASAQPVTLSFWATSSLTGTFSGAIQNAAQTRSYVFIYTIASPNTPQKFTINIPGDTAGTWVMSGAARAAFLVFDLGGGTSFKTASINAWVAGQFDGQTSANRLISTNAAKLSITGVKLELGSVATSFNSDPLAVRIARCLRYYQNIGPMMLGGCATGSGQTMWAGSSITPMRATPSLTFSNIVYGSSSGLAAAGAQSPTSFAITFVSSVTGNCNVTFNVALSAEI